MPAHRLWCPHGCHLLSQRSSSRAISPGADATMTRHTRSHVDDLRGAGQLAIDAIRGVTELVEAMHVTIASGPAVLGQPLAAPARAITRPIYAAIQGVMQLVGDGIDLALAQLAPVLGASAPGI